VPTNIAGAGMVGGIIIKTPAAAGIHYYLAGCGAIGCNLTQVAIIRIPAPILLSVPLNHTLPRLSTLI